MEELEQRLAKTLSPHRLQHCRSVAAYAEHLAEHWHLDAGQAYRAGLLHDMMHYLSDEELLAQAAAYQLPVGEAEREIPLLLHGPLAARILEKDYGCDDTVLLDAIRLHTVPDPEMDDLAKIIFIADIAEPTRPAWDGLEEIRSLAEQDLDAALIKALQRTLDYLHSRGKKAHPDTGRILALLQAKQAKKTEGAEKMTSSEKLLEKCVALALEKKGRDLVSLKLAGLTLISDYFLIVTATSSRHAQTLCDHIETEMTAAGVSPLRIEGYREGRWILMDFGTVVVHIFVEDERAYYDLERLWGDAERVAY